MRPTYEGNVVLKPVTGETWMISIHISNLGRRSSISNKTGFGYLLDATKSGDTREDTVGCGESVSALDACHHGILIPWVPIRGSVAALAVSCTVFLTSITW